MSARLRVLGALLIVAAVVWLPAAASAQAPGGGADLSFSGSVRGHASLNEMATWSSGAGTASWCSNQCGDLLSLTVGSGTPSKTGGGVSLSLVFTDAGVTASSSSGECSLNIQTRSE